MEKIVKLRWRILFHLCFILLCLVISGYESRKIEPERNIQHTNVSPKSQTRGVDGGTESGVRRCLGKECENVDITTEKRHHNGASRRGSRPIRNRHRQRLDALHKSPALHPGHHGDRKTRTELPRNSRTNRRRHHKKKGRKYQSPSHRQESPRNLQLKNDELPFERHPPHHRSSQKEFFRTSLTEDSSKSRNLSISGQGLIVGESALPQKHGVHHQYNDKDLQISPGAMENGMQNHSPFRYSRRQGYRRRYGYGQRAPAAVSRLEQRMRPKLNVAVHNLKQTMANVLQIMQKKVKKVSERFMSIHSGARHDITEVKNQLKVIHDENNRAYDALLDVTQLVRFVHLRAYERRVAPVSMSIPPDMHFKDFSHQVMLADQAQSRAKAMHMILERIKSRCMDQERQYDAIFKSFKNRDARALFVDIARYRRRIETRLYGQIRGDVRQRIHTYQRYLNSLTDRYMDARNYSYTANKEIRAVQRDVQRNIALRNAYIERRPPNDQTVFQTMAPITNIDEIEQLATDSYQKSRQLGRTVESMARTIIPVMKKAKEFIAKRSKTGNNVRLQLLAIVGRLADIVVKLDRRMDELRILLADEAILRERCEDLVTGSGGGDDEDMVIDCEQYIVILGSGGEELMTASMTTPRPRLSITSTPITKSTTLKVSTSPSTQRPSTSLPPTTKSPSLKTVPSTPRPKTTTPAKPTPRRPKATTAVQSTDRPKSTTPTPSTPNPKTTTTPVPSTPSPTTTTPVPSTPRPKTTTHVPSTQRPTTTTHVPSTQRPTTTTPVPKTQRPSTTVPSTPRPKTTTAITTTQRQSTKVPSTPRPKTTPIPTTQRPSTTVPSTPRPKTTPIPTTQRPSTTVPSTPRPKTTTPAPTTASPSPSTTSKNIPMTPSIYDFETTSDDDDIVFSGDDILSVVSDKPTTTVLHSTESFTTRTSPVTTTTNTPTTLASEPTTVPPPTTTESVSTTKIDTAIEIGSGNEESDFVIEESEKDNEDTGGWGWPFGDDPNAGAYHNSFRDKLQKRAENEREKSDELISRSIPINRRHDVIVERWGTVNGNVAIIRDFVNNASEINSMWMGTRPEIESTHTRIAKLSSKINKHDITIRNRLEQAKMIAEAELQKAQIDQNGQQPSRQHVKMMTDLLAKVETVRSSMHQIKEITESPDVQPCLTVQREATKLRNNIAELREKIDRARAITSALPVAVAMVDGREYNAEVSSTSETLSPVTSLEVCFKPERSAMTVASFHGNGEVAYGIELVDSVPTVSVTGTDGELYGTIKSSVTLETSQWYNLHVTRTGHTIEMRTTRLGNDTEPTLEAIAFPDMQVLQRSPTTVQVSGSSPPDQRSANVSGCIGSVIVNGQAVGLANTGNTTQAVRTCTSECGWPTSPSMVFDGDGYVLFPMSILRPYYRVDSLFLKFSTRQREGVLLLLNDQRQHLQMLLSVSEGSIHMEARTKRGTTVLRSKENIYADGLFHAVEVNVQTKEIEATLDGVPETFTPETFTQEIPLRIDDGIYVGGLGLTSQIIGGKTKLRSLTGCISKLRITDRDIPMYMLQESKNVVYGSCSDSLWHHCVQFVDISTPVTLEDLLESSRIYVTVSAGAVGTILNYKRKDKFNINIDLDVAGVTITESVVGNEEKLFTTLNHEERWVTLVIEDLTDSVKVSLNGTSVTLQHKQKGWFAAGGDDPPEYQITIGGEQGDEVASLNGGIARVIVNDVFVDLASSANDNNLQGCEKLIPDLLEMEKDMKPVC